MPDLVDTANLHHALAQLAQAVDAVAAEVGDVQPIRRLRHDIERFEMDLGDCQELRRVAAPPKLEVIPDTPYPDTLWQGVDDEGVGGFHAPHASPSRPRSSHHR